MPFTQSSPHHFHAGMDLRPPMRVSSSFLQSLRGAEEDENEKLCHSLWDNSLGMYHQNHFEVQGVSGCKVSSCWVRILGSAAEGIFQATPWHTLPLSYHFACGISWFVTHLAVVVCALPFPKGSSVRSTRSVGSSAVPGIVDFPSASAWKMINCYNLC